MTEQKIPTAVVTLAVAVDEFDFGKPGDLDNPVAAARAGYEQMQGFDFLPVVTVEMPDGTKHEVDLDVEGLDEEER